jgi:hypothetical protein
MSEDVNGSCGPMLSEAESRAYLAAVERYRRLQASVDLSEAHRLYSLVRSMQARFHTYQTNAVELGAIIIAHRERLFKGDLGDALNRRPLYDLLFESTRRLHNFVSSAVSVIEYAERIIKQEYRQNLIVQDAHRQAIRSCFANGIQDFTVRLRDLFAHDHSPSIVSAESGSDEKEDYFLSLGSEDVENLIRSRIKRDRGKAKEVTQSALRYLDAWKRDVNLSEYLSQYDNSIRVFYGWFQKEFHEWCRPVWEQAGSLREEIKELELAWLRNRERLVNLKAR